MEKLKIFLKENSLPFDDFTLGQFKRFMELVLEWNQNVNITAIKDPVEFEEKHLIDSLSVACFSKYIASKHVADIGTGAGLPGIPLAILSPDKEFLLLDSVGKKLKIVDAIAKELGLNNVKTLHARAEDPAHDFLYREKFDFVVARALANMSVLSEYCIPYVKVGGWFVAYKTKAAEEEVKQASNAIQTLGGALSEITEDTLHSTDHILVWIKKERTTASIYPRKAGLPSKNPL
ncbi:MAG: 16S rRNA (guanine(527)-N(7))-methyltransferase RsmG [Clostridia bacterium]|nr:16S rRNA (guanine(527)-N(7))-methyltransferase RsmG [Clostridia bacterium]